VSQVAQRGTLFVCPTPLGNLEDITLRVLRVLKEVDLIAAENTQHTQKLLHHFDIHKPMVSYYDSGSSEAKEEKLIEKLNQGKSIALVSSAGTPLVSDPGFKLVRRCYEEGLSVVSLPGPSACVTALVASGLPTNQFFFAGFLSSKSKARKTMLKQVKSFPATLVFYEAPHRILESLKDCLEVLGDRPAALVRELTKIHEEVIGGTLSLIVKKVEERPPKGEITLVIAGEEAPEEIEPGQLKQEIEALVEKGVSIREASREIAKKYDISKNKVYALAHNLTR